MSDTFLFAKHRRPAAAQPDPLAGPTLPPWRVLVVDDEPEVHQVTRLALRKLRFKGRGLQILEAMSGAEARRVIAEARDIAVILLDVVMETDDAGLDLVRHIREDLQNRAVRIVLRTGQPGQAPEQQVIVEYDINDYKAKTELTVDKLFTTTIAALRAYEDILALEANRSGLETIIEASDNLFQIRSMTRFASGVLTQLSAFLEADTNGILCAQRRPDAPASEFAPHILAASGRFIDMVDRRLADVDREAGVVDTVRCSLATRRNTFGDGFSCLYIGTPHGEEMAAYLDSPKRLSDLDRRLVELFCSKISVGFANIRLYEELREANEHLEQRVVARTAELAQANRELERLATRDALTGAFNRRHFLACATSELERAARYGHAVSLLLLDLDHFKAVNDTYGHLVGDEALRVAVTAVSGGLRDSDLLGRYGGEEFAVLLTETGPAEALQAADRLRRAVELQPIEHAGGSLHITVSIGHAALGTGDGSITDLLSRADAALYAAKQAGRNRVISAEGAGGRQAAL